MKSKPTYQELENELKTYKAATTLIEKSPVMHFLWRNKENWPVEFVTNNIEPILGYTVEDFQTGKAIYSKIIHPDDLERVSQEVSKNCELDNISFEHEPYRIICKNGDTKWLKDITSIRKDKNNIITHFEGIIIDITQQKNNQSLIKKQQEELQKSKEQIIKSEDKFRTIIDYTYDWEYLTDTDDNFIYVSPACERISGYTATDFLNEKKLLNRIIHPDDREDFLKHQHHLDDKGYRQPVDFRIITKSNKVEWIGHVCQNIYDNDGNIQGIRGSNRLITKQKKSEHYIKMLSDIVEQSPMTIVITNTKGDLEYVNKAFEKISGYTFEEAIGQNPRILKSDKAEREKYIELWETITKGNVWEGEFINKRKNGEEYIERAIIAPTINKQNEIVNYFSIKEDITKQKIIEQNLKESEERFKAIFSQSKAIMLIINPVTKQIEQANNAAQLYYNYSEEQLLQMKISEINTLSETEIEKTMKSVLKSGKTYYEFKHKLASGQVRDVQVYVSNQFRPK